MGSGSTRSLREYIRLCCRLCLEGPCNLALSSWLISSRDVFSSGWLHTGVALVSSHAIVEMSSCDRSRGGSQCPLV